jgi:hypothetical protein
MEKKQTAVEWLESQINLGLSERGLISAIEQAKQMEKEQIVNSYRRGCMSDDIKFADDYYNETFGGTE